MLAGVSESVFEVFYSECVFGVGLEESFYRVHLAAIRGAFVPTTHPLVFLTRLFFSLTLMFLQPS